MFVQKATWNQFIYAMVMANFMPYCQDMLMPKVSITPIPPCHSPNPQPCFAHLPERALGRISGAQAREFLQGLVTQDMHAITRKTSVYSCMLTPQGRFLFDFFVSEHPSGDLLLEADKTALPDLIRRLKPYTLRRKVELAVMDSALYEVYALWGGEHENNWAEGLYDTPPAAGDTVQNTDILPKGTVTFSDPRLVKLGGRVYLPISSTTLDAKGSWLPDAHHWLEKTAADYNFWRLENAIPDGTQDLIHDQSIMLESGMEPLNALSWDKGCYMGQELTARTKYRALIKKQLQLVRLDGDMGNTSETLTGLAVIDDTGKAVGEMRSHQGNLGFALLRLEALDRPLFLDVSAIGKGNVLE